MKEYNSPKEAAEILSVKREHILRLINNGQLPASNVGTGQRKVYRISIQDLNNYLKQQKTNGKSNNPQN
ncbi:helix-turn-helix domain-containing protein [Candidatus Babeliales bacterium]|nr:helix-turn-helix domain-containing protein [Candidatus Babeliales bacterium]